MNAIDRLWALGAAIVAIAVLAGAWFGTVSPDLDAAASADSERSNVEMQNSIHETRLAGLEEAASRMGEFAAVRDELAQGIPAEAEYSAFLRELQRLASQTGVQLQGLTTGEAMLYASPVEAAPEAPAAEDPAAEGAAEDGGTDETAQADAASTSETPADTAGAPGEIPAPVPYVDPQINADNLAAIPVTITAEGEESSLLDFLRRVQTGARLISLGTVSVVEATETEPARLDTSGYLYTMHGQEVSPQP
ncbi:hypothetical protein [Agrococcus baldri]|uniref:Tfp pilus assembly protein PilO n=1 Tax=Agrococcus baldri TaxID=153730 RepID=A0AA87RID0_9MICO|nr:hypothetical protein [Agrococcus baldri]GEK80994.1 hypothetical protein ABA31_23450 [Agrococcus baldri]